mmetsp:Transcript_6446/g.12903  ORF Transcript_6446/g.12903 Transcript_6446/m.12903 type:complete len:117 (-) Transcript_6446:255-605(-)
MLQRLVLAAFAVGAAAFGSTPMDHGGHGHMDHGHHSGGGHANMEGGACICGNYPLFAEMQADMHEMCVFGTKMYMPNSGSMHAMAGDYSCAEARESHGLSDDTPLGADCSKMAEGC